MSKKPLGRKNYGSIPHLPGSRMGPGDHHCHEGQDRIATVKARDRNDTIIVQEKLDGSNVGVARIGYSLHPIGRAGYMAVSSKYLQHRLFHNWAYENHKRFLDVLDDGERLVGEWLLKAHGTRYSLPHEPFVAFDIMIGDERLPYQEFMDRVDGLFITPAVVSIGGPCSIERAMNKLGDHGFHGAIDQVEGAVWRIERDKPTGVKGEKTRIVDFLVKYVRPDKVDGVYLDLGGGPVWNTYPTQGA